MWALNQSLIFFQLTQLLCVCTRYDVKNLLCCRTKKKDSTTINCGVNRETLTISFQCCLIKSNHLPEDHSKRINHYNKKKIVYAPIHIDWNQFYGKPIYFLMFNNFFIMCECGWFFQNILSIYFFLLPKW